MAKNIFRKAIFYIFHQYIKRDRFCRYDAFLADSQFWRREKLLQYQWGLCRELIEYAYNTVPYYKQLFGKCGLTPSSTQARKDLVNIPVLNKNDITNNFERFKAQGVEDWRAQPDATSGSTGMNFRFLSDKGVFIRPALQKRCYDWMGIDYFDRRMLIWGAAWDVKKSRKIKSRIKGLIKNSMVLSGYNLSEQDIEKHFAQMRRLKPELLISYPSIFFELTLVTQKKGISYCPHALQPGVKNCFRFSAKQSNRYSGLGFSIFTMPVICT